MRLVRYLLNLTCPECHNVPYNEKSVNMTCGMIEARALTDLFANFIAAVCSRTRLMRSMTCGMFRSATVSAGRTPCWTRVVCQISVIRSAQPAVLVRVSEVCNLGRRRSPCSESVPPLGVFRPKRHYHLTDQLKRRRLASSSPLHKPKCTHEWRIKRPNNDAVQRRRKAHRGSRNDCHAKPS